MKAKKVKEYQMQVQFNAYGMTVKARSMKEAKAKVYEKLRKKDIIKMLDKPNCYLDEA